MSKLKNATTGSVLATDIERARNVWQRTVGLIPRERLSANQGLWIDQCSTIHTMGMRCAIDVFFLDRQGYLLKVARAVAPNSGTLGFNAAHTVIETGAGADEGHDVLIGDRLILES
jgi:uncharacterized membrane protein (UPF0127 family)